MKEYVVEPGGSLDCVRRRRACHRFRPWRGPFGKTQASLRTPKCVPRVHRYSDFPVRDGCTCSLSLWERVGVRALEGRASTSTVILRNSSKHFPRRISVTMVDGIEILRSAQNGGLEE